MDLITKTVAVGRRGKKIVWIDGVTEQHSTEVMFLKRKEKVVGSRL